MQIKVFQDTMLAENTYVYYDNETKKGVVIDPSGNLNETKKFIKDNNLSIEYIMLTHGHVDHIMDAEELRKYTDAKIVAYKLEKDLLNDGVKNLSAQFLPKKIDLEADIYVGDREKLKMNGLTFSFFHTPGHTAGGMCIRCNNIMFTGDTIFKGSIGRTDLYSGDYEKLLKSLKKLAKMENELILYPGHGLPTTIGEEKTSNYYMGLIL